VVIRENHLCNSEPVPKPVTYSEAVYVEKSKRDATLVLKGSQICVGLTVGRWQDNGWKMTPEEWEKIRSGDPVLIYSESGKCRAARFVTGAQHFGAKVIYEGETEVSPVAAKNIGVV
jgi:hypothetical protein